MTLSCLAVFIERHDGRERTLTRRGRGETLSLSLRCCGWETWHATSPKVRLVSCCISAAAD